MARSISSASLALTGLTSTLSNGATAWMFGSLVLYIDQRRSLHLTLRCFPQSKSMTVPM
jgi:hypothetical protein